MHKYVSLCDAGSNTPLSDAGNKLTMTASSLFYYKCKKYQRDASMTASSLS